MVRPHHRAAFDRPRPVVEPNAPRPYRAPVHQLGIAVRGDRAAVGIAHAGEVLAAVRIDRDAAIACAGQLVAAARALGATDDELATATGLIAPTQRPKRTSRRPRAPRPPRPIETECRDCGASIAVAPRGPVPRRCPACKVDYFRQYARDRYQRRRGS